MGTRKKRAIPKVSGPFLRRITALENRVDPSRYPFNISAFSHGIEIEITSNVTFFVGENGSGKSTLLEATAENSGFNPEGGGRDHQFAEHKDPSDLASALRLSWTPKVTDGFFMRAESFYNLPATSNGLAAISEGTVAGHSTISLTVHGLSRYSRTALTAEFTSSMSQRLRYLLRGNSAFSVLSIN